MRVARPRRSTVSTRAESFVCAWRMRSMSSFTATISAEAADGSSSSRAAIRIARRARPSSSRSGGAAERVHRRRILEPAERLRGADSDAQPAVVQVALEALSRLDALRATGGDETGELTHRADRGFTHALVLRGLRAHGDRRQQRRISQLGEGLDAGRPDHVVVTGSAEAGHQEVAGVRRTQVADRPARVGHRVVGRLDLHVANEELTDLRRVRFEAGEGTDRRAPDARVAVFEHGVDQGVPRVRGRRVLERLRALGRARRGSGGPRVRR